MRYWLYATRSDVQPDNTLSVGPNHASFASVDYSMTPGEGYSGAAQYLHNVGSFTGSTSHYGSFDQTGSLWEFLEGAVWDAADERFECDTRGGSWGNGAQHLPATARAAVPVYVENSNYGLRIAKPAP